MAGGDWAFRLLNGRHVVFFHPMMTKIIDLKALIPIKIGVINHRKMKMLYKANDYSNDAYIGTRFRRRRFQYFKREVKNASTGPIRLLDIGGTVSFWVNEKLPYTEGHYDHHCQLEGRRARASSH